MENEEEFLHAAAILKDLDQQLSSLGDGAITKAQAEVRKEIEAHFDKCIRALQYRKEALLREVDARFQDKRKLQEVKGEEVKTTIETCRKTLLAGVALYNKDKRDEALNLWKSLNEFKPKSGDFGLIKASFQDFYEYVADYGSVCAAFEEPRLSKSSGIEPRGSSKSPSMDASRSPKAERSGLRKSSEYEASSRLSKSSSAEPAKLNKSSSVDPPSVKLSRSTDVEPPSSKMGKSPSTEQPPTSKLRTSSSIDPPSVKLNKSTDEASGRSPNMESSRLNKSSSVEPSTTSSKLSKSGNAEPPTKTRSSSVSDTASQGKSSPTHLSDTPPTSHRSSKTTHLDGKTTQLDSKYSDSKYSDSKYSDSKYSDNKYSDNKYSDSKYSDSKYSDSKYSDSKYSDSKYLDTKTTQQDYKPDYKSDTSSVSSSESSKSSKRESLKLDKLSLGADLPKLGKTSATDNSRYSKSLGEGPVKLSLESPREKPTLVDSPRGTNKVASQNKVTTVTELNYGLEGRIGSNAQLRHPNGICFNPHDRSVYVTDNGHVIFKVTQSGDTKLFAKRGDTQLYNPMGITCYYKENCFFVTSQLQHSIKMVNSMGIVTVVAGSGKEGMHDGIGLKTGFSHPVGITVDQLTGDLYVSDFGNHAIRKITAQGVVTTLAGVAGKKGFADGVGKSAFFNCPLDICFNDKDQSLVVCDSHNHKIRRVALNGEVSTLGEISKPCSIAITPKGSFIVASHSENKIYHMFKEREREREKRERERQKRERERGEEQERERD